MGVLKEPLGREVCKKAVTLTHSLNNEQHSELPSV